MNAAYPKLRSTIQIGPITLRNRAYMSGHSMLLGNAAGVTDRLRGYLVERAKGGAAMVGIESAPIHPSSIDAQNPLPLYSDAIVPSLARAADAVHAAGARLMIILTHRGSHVSHLATHAPAVAPWGVPDILTGDVPRVLTHRDIKELIKAYAIAAERCRAAGVDVVEVLAGLDYLMGAFLNPVLNRRTDEYGGSQAGRARFLLEVVETVREATKSELATGTRISISDVVEEDEEEAMQRSIATIQLLTQQGLIDYVSLIKGSYRRMDGAMPMMHLPRALHASQAQRIRNSVNVPVAFAGRIRTPSEAEALLDLGAVDLIAMARTWIAEPHWMRKIEAGEEESIRPCISCNQGCVGFIARGLPGTCILNPSAGREAELGDLEPSGFPRRIAIVGGGPAGLEAARVAAIRGHHVSLFEQGLALGGDLALAAKDPQRREMQLALDWWERELWRLKVDIMLGHRIEHSFEVSADVVIWAVGAQPSQIAVQRYRPQLFEGIPGTKGLPFSREILRGLRTAHGNTLIIDEEGGWPVLIAAESLQCDPAVTSVTVISAEGAALGENHINFTLERGQVARRIRRSGIKVRLQTLASAVDGAFVMTTEGERLGPYDTIVLSTGTTPPAMPDQTVLIGDCLAPRGIWAAVNDAYGLARSL
jgi:2,4-dienoyl-CoA reductase-like NADH-dependent reductase (Old Yellow Enzyme family)